MSKQVDIAVIGAGTAGLSAIKEIKKTDKSFLLIDPGPYGTTCARVGCMPSKVFIHVANAFYNRNKLKDIGIGGSENLTVDIGKVMSHVRDMRDYFTSGVIKSTLNYGENLIQEKVVFLEPNKLQVGDEIISAKKIIIATGSQSIVLKDWHSFREKIITSENFFEQKNFPNKIAVIGAGVIGLELGQALNRLGVEVTMFNAGTNFAGISDPEINDVAEKIFSSEFKLHNDCRATVKQKGDLLETSCESGSVKTEKILAALGRRPNLIDLNLSCLEVPCDDHGIPQFDNSTMQVEDHPIFIAGDANTTRPLLHEAADEGRIAGFNASRDHAECFERRVPISITFTDPNIAMVGKRFSDLKEGSFVIGRVSFEKQGRSKIIQENKGQLNVYADKETGALLGAEMIAPAGEHIAHLLAWAVQQKLTVFEILQMPYYHPTIEEGLRTAIRDAAKQVNASADLAELAMCASDAVI